MENASRNALDRLTALPGASVDAKGVVSIAITPKNADVVLPVVARPLRGKKLKRWSRRHGMPSTGTSPRGARQRGAGRPAGRRRTVRSSAESGDSGDPEPEPEPQPRLCECGCGADLDALGKRPQARYLDDAHRMRLARGIDGVFRERAEQLLADSPTLTIDAIREFLALDPVDRLILADAAGVERSELLLCVLVSPAPGPLTEVVA